MVKQIKYMMNPKLFAYIECSIGYLFIYFMLRFISLEGAENPTLIQSIGALSCFTITMIWFITSRIYLNYIISKIRCKKWSISMKKINFYTSPVALKVTLAGVVLLEVFVFEFVI